jgi:hypothetical protein
LLYFVPDCFNRFRIYPLKRFRVAAAPDSAFGESEQLS